LICWRGQRHRVGGAPLRRPAAPHWDRPRSAPAQPRDRSRARVERLQLWSVPSRHL